MHYQFRFLNKVIWQQFVLEQKGHTKSWKMATLNNLFWSGNVYLRATRQMTILPHTYLSLFYANLVEFVQEQQGHTCSRVNGKMPNTNI